MRPTFSIIFFTVLSGAGYGAWFLQGVGLTIGWVCGAPGRTNMDGVTLRLCRFVLFDQMAFMVALLCVGAGLLASLGHLGKPTRAWRALSQWRTSWLSREGIAALFTFVPVAILILQQSLGILHALTHGYGTVEPRWWNAHAWNTTWLPLLGALVAFGSIVTVLCTANIYASLKPIRAWRDPRVVPGYLLFALYSGSLLRLAFGSLDGIASRRDEQALLAGVIVLSIVGASLKHRYWRSIDALPVVDAGHATGLESLGSVRSFEQPHTEENYLTHEMGFVLARKHARKLRRIVLILGFLVPAVLAVFALAVPAFLMPAIWIALVAGLAGVFVERWLFFAEAKHAVMAYYAR